MKTIKIVTFLFCLFIGSISCIAGTSQKNWKALSILELTNIQGGANNCGSVCGKGADKPCPREGKPDCSDKENLNCTSCGKVCYDDQSARTCGEGGDITSKCTDNVVGICGMKHYHHIYRGATGECYYSGMTTNINQTCASPKDCKNG